MARRFFERMRNGRIGDSDERDLIATKQLSKM
jgi:hypothetical protein